MSYQLIIGNKNLSSWSLRPWLLMKQMGIAFEEKLVRLDVPSFSTEIKKHSPSGMVPCLIDGDQAIWDSLAIAEYLHERHPEQALWPEGPNARAFARCMVAEMHSGFSTLRTVWPMDMVKEGVELTTPRRVRSDLDRIFSLWSEARTQYGQDGPFLFGEFSIADAFYAPVVSRITSYGPVVMSVECKAYIETIWSLPAMAEWREGAHAEVADGWYSS